MSRFQNMRNLYHSKSQYLPLHNRSSQLEAKARKNWRQLLHPQIQQKYQLLKKEKEDGLSALRVPDISNHEDAKSIAWQKSLLQKIPDSTFDDSKSHYEARISVLEHQNANLKEELFYLREAILQIYTKKQEGRVDQNC